MSVKAAAVALYLFVCGYFIVPIAYYLGFMVLGAAVPPFEELMSRHHEGYRQFLRIDYCYDWGGVWDRQTNDCDIPLAELCRFAGRVWDDRIVRCVEPEAAKP
jgi:hypothetical protein